MNTGEEAIRSKNGLVTTIACGIGGKITYALEGSVFVAGSAIQWLRDEMKFFPKAAMSEDYAARSSSDCGVFVVPAFTGLGAPYWDDRCRGAIFGITRGTTQADITRATLDSLAYQTRDVLDAMEQDSGIEISTLKVDGGACANNLLMQFQSDLLQCDITRPTVVETTALGAAYLCGLALGIYESLDDVRANNAIGHTVTPEKDDDWRETQTSRWKHAVEKSLAWAE
jgi:glycerol kinase